MKILFSFAFFFVAFSINSNSQVFADVTDELGIAAMNGATFYGVGSSFFDVNEDGWDDLTICIAGGATRLYMNNQGVFQLQYAFDNIYDAKTCLWGDYDEDGDNDLFIIKRDGPSQLFVQTDSLVFTNQSSSLNFPYNSTYNSFGAALGDYNRDSYLDLYVANYSTATAGGKKSMFLTNNQNGGYNSNLHGYNRNHFQPVFIDLYRDLYQDIYVIVDFRVGSEYFLQGTNGEFTDHTLDGAFGLDEPIDAMTNSWCDYDNDADLDVYIANTPTNGNSLMQNDGTNNFSNVAPSTGASLYKWSWSSLWLDIENDGWNDLVIDERHVNQFFLNDYGNHVLGNTQGTFTEIENTGISNLPYGFFTSSKGDFNNDGLYDLYLGAESGQVSRVFKNNTETENNYLKCRLKGRLSNHNGVGTYIDYYVGGTHRVHYTQLGENYLCQNSQNLIFGMGQETVIDSLKLSWISGVVDTYYNLPANTTHVFIEGETRPQIEASKQFLCPSGSDSLQLSISGWPMHIWGNGSNENSIWVSAPGVYSVTVSTGFGHSLELYCEVSFQAMESVVMHKSDVLCNGDSNGAFEIINSSNGEVLIAEENLSAGAYSAQIVLAAGCVVEQQIIIEEPLPFYLVVDSIFNSCTGQDNGRALVYGLDGTAPYSDFSEYGMLQLMDLAPGVYSDTISDSNGCLSSYSFEIAEIPYATIDVISPIWVCPNDSVEFDASVAGIEGPYFWGDIGPGSVIGSGSYILTVVDTLQCVTSLSVTIEEITLPVITANVDSESMLGLGNISIDVLGNYPPYTATWETGFVGLNFTELAEGNYNVTITDSLGCSVDTTFTVLYNFVEEGEGTAEFIVDWKTGQLKYVGNERLFSLEIFNAIGQLVFTTSSLGANESLHLNISPQPIYISSSKGNSRSKVILR